MDTLFSGQKIFASKDDSQELEILKTTLEYVPAAISICDEKTQHVFQNQSFFELLGYEFHHLKDKTLEAIYVDSDMYEKVTESLSLGQSWSGEIEMIQKTGEIIPVMLCAEPIKDSEDNIVACVGSFIDLSQKLRKEQELESQKEYLSTLHSISLGMFRRLDLSELLNAIVLKVSKVTQVPNGFLYLYDTDKNELVLKSACGCMSDFIGYKVQPAKGFAGIIFQKGEPIILDNYQVWDSNLKEPFASQTFAKMGIPLISGSKIKGVLGVCHDTCGKKINPGNIAVLEEFAAIAQIAIDNSLLFERQKEELERRILLEKERKEMEVHLFESQRMDAVGTLAGGIAHDFNNILSTIMGFAQIAQSASQAGSTMEEDLKEIYTASLRAKDLVQQILTFARQSDDHVNAIRVNLIVKEVLKFVRSSIPTTITIKHNIIAKEKVLANPTQIYQIFLNLFTNAAQAMEKDGGILSVELKETTLEDEDSPGDLGPGQYIKAQVSDTGTGIAKDQLHSIFEPYFTTKEVGEGTGLGLSVVHGAVKSMGGEVFVESKIGKGTTFTLFFPIVQKVDSTVDDQSGEQSQSLGKGEHVLFVDDEEPIVKVGKRMLESNNYKVTALTNSQDALEAFRLKPDDFDVVVTDMTMPDMTGEKLAGELKKIRSDIPVVLCSGHHQYASNQDLLARGLDYICSKPISNQELANVVRKALDGILPE